MQSKVYKIQGTKGADDQSIPIVPCHHIAKRKRWCVAYGPLVINKRNKLRYHPTIAILYPTKEKDLYLVHGRDEILDKLGTGQSFSLFVTQENWDFWRCDYSYTDPETGLTKEIKSRPMDISKYASVVTKIGDPCLPDGRSIMKPSAIEFNKEGVV